MSSSEFYFIYPRHISKKEKIYNWLNIWLSPIYKHEYFILEGNIYYNYSIFKLALYTHGIYYDMTNNKYLWHTVENYYMNSTIFLASKRFDTYDEAVHEGVEEFYLKWKNTL